jgi:hypothetical protein
MYIGYALADGDIPDVCPVIIPQMLLTYQAPSGHVSELFVNPVNLPNLTNNNGTLQKYAWFDHRNGAATGIAIVNYASAPATLTVSFIDGDTGNRIVTHTPYTMMIPPYTHQSFIATDMFPETIGHQGSLYISSQYDSKSSTGGVLVLRYNSGGAFTQE